MQCPKCGTEITRNDVMEDGSIRSKESAEAPDSNFSFNIFEAFSAIAEASSLSVLNNLKTTVSFTFTGILLESCAYTKEKDNKNDNRKKKAEYFNDFIKIPYLFKPSEILLIVFSIFDINSGSFEIEASIFSSSLCSLAG